MSKEHITIVGDGRTQAEVEARVKQIKNLLEGADAEYEKEKLNERIARLSGGVAVIQAGGGCWGGGGERRGRGGAGRALRSPGCIALGGAPGPGCLFKGCAGQPVGSSSRLGASSGLGWAGCVPMLPSAAPPLH